MSDPLTRIEQKLDTLIEAVTQLANLFADEEEEQQAQTLEGEPDGGERDQSQSL